MRAGDLWSRVTIQTKTVTRGALGGATDNWTDFVTVNANVRDLTAREILLAQQVGNAVDKIVTMRYRTDVDASMRVVFDDGKVGRILAIVSSQQRRVFLQLMCEVVDD